MNSLFRFSTFLFIFLILTFGCSPLVKVTEKKTGGVVKEEYHVKRENREVRDGQAVTYYKKWKRAEGSYEDGVKDGLWSFYEAGGGLLFRGRYKNGEKTGRWKYYSDQKLCGLTVYREGKKDSVWTGYNSEGKVIARRTYDRGSLEHFVTYYSNGNVKRQTTYSDGLREGNHEEFFKNGKLFYRVSYREDKVHALDTFQDPKGNLLDAGDLSEGDGLIRWYSYNDSLNNVWVSSEINYQKGLRSGNAVFYYENGNKRSKGKFLEGEKIGGWEYYNEDGSLKNKVTHEKSEGPSLPDPDIKVVVEVHPTFPGGESELMSFLGENMKYPKKARNAGV